MPLRTDSHVHSVADSVEEAPPHLLLQGGPVHHHHRRLVPRRRRRLGRRRRRRRCGLELPFVRLFPAPPGRRGCHHVADVALAGLDAAPRELQCARRRRWGCIIYVLIYLPFNKSSRNRDMLHQPFNLRFRPLHIQEKLEKFRRRIRLI